MDYLNWTKVGHGQNFSSYILYDNFMRIDFCASVFYLFIQKDRPKRIV
jgi:hypothetical protein